MLYPQQNDTRNMLHLSGFWEFKLDPDEVGEEEGWFGGLASPRAIAVPASWNEQFQDTRDYMGMAWYVREAYVPQGWKGQRIFIRVGSANYAAKVWVNGAAIGEHQGGHLPFAFDITEQIVWDKPNVIAIQVENRLMPTRVPPGNVSQGPIAAFMASYPNTSFDFFPYAGLHRPVILYAVPQVHIEDIAVVTVLERNTGLVKLTVVQSDGDGEGQISLAGENGIAKASLTFVNGVADATLRVPNARLWCPDDPYLYKLTVVLTENEQVVDRYTLHVGIRTVEVRGHELLLNGKPVFLKGLDRHEDFPVHGRGLNTPLVVKNHALLKWVGANSYRTSHYPYSVEAMQMADREGILIVDEIPAVGLFFEDGEANIQTRLEQCKQQLHDLIARDKNHPSVIIWSVANEPVPSDLIMQLMGDSSGSDNAVGTAFFAELFDLARELDPTRLVTLAGIMGCPVEWLALSDVVFINRYWGWYTQGGQLDTAAALLEQEVDGLYGVLQKPMVISEFGADAIAGTHSDPPEMWSEEYQVEIVRRYLDVADQKPFIVGVYVWNLADFKTGQSTRRAGGMNLKGVFTRDRRPKMAAHFLRERWTMVQDRPTASMHTPAESAHFVAESNCGK